MITSIRIWLQAIRPKTLLLSGCPVLMGGAIALSEGIFLPLAFFITAITSLGIQVCTNLANDYFDFVKGADTENRKGPTRVTASGLVSQSSMKKALVIVFSLTAILSFYLIWEGGYVIAILASLSLLLALLYTAGPLSIAYLGLAEFFVLIFFGPIAVGGTYYLQMHTLSHDALLAGFAPGLLSSAVLVINNLRDIEEDRIANKKTLIVRFGRGFGKAEFTVFVLLALFSPLLFVEEHPFVLLSMLTLFPAIPLLIQVLKNEDPLALNPIFVRTAKLPFIFTILFSIGWML